MRKKKRVLCAALTCTSSTGGKLECSIFKTILVRIKTIEFFFLKVELSYSKKKTKLKLGTKIVKTVWFQSNAETSVYFKQKLNKQKKKEAKKEYLCVERAKVWLFWNPLLFRLGFGNPNVFCLLNCFCSGIDELDCKSGSSLFGLLKKKYL